MARSCPSGHTWPPSAPSPLTLPDTKRIPIALCCSVCSARNYKTTKARKNGAKPLQLKKFCNTCNAHTVHNEGK